MQTFALWPAAGLVLGAALSPWAPPAGRVAVWGLGLTWLAALLWWRRRSGPGAWLSLAALTLHCSIAGWALAGRAGDAARHPSLRTVLDEWFDHFRLDDIAVPSEVEPVQARLVLTEDAARRDDVVAFRARAVALARAGVWRAVTGGVAVSVGGTVDEHQLRRWTAGTELTVPALFRRPARYLDRGVPDAEEARALRGVSLLASVKSGFLVERTGDGRLLSRLGAGVRWRVRDALQRDVGALDATSAAVVTAVLIGDERGIADEVRQRWQRAGIYHVLAISGGNIAVLVTVVMLAGRAAGGPPRAVAGAACLALLGFAVVVAPGASVERATVMALLVVGAQVLDHRTVPWQAWAVAVATMVVRDPLALGQPALLLTCGATAALLAMMQLPRGLVARGRAVDGAIPTPGTPKVFQRQTLLRPLRWVLAVVVATIGVEAVVFPVGLWFFGQLSLAGIVLNVLAIPLMTAAQLAGMGLVALDAAGGAAWTYPLAWTAHAAVWTVDAGTRALDVMPWLSRAVPRPPALLVGVYYAALVMCWRGSGWRRLVAGAVAAAAAGQMARGAIVAAPPAPGHVRLTMLDVGQGESMLVESGAHGLLVDAGGRPFGDGTDIGRAVVAPALWARGRRSLDAMLVTHADPDHVGGAVAVLEAFHVPQLWLGVDVPHHDPTRALLAAAEREPARLVRRLRGDGFMLGQTRVRVLHPPAPDWERRRVRNDDSVVLEMVHGDVSILLLGDVGAQVEREILPLLTPARVRVLKVGHHGSRTSTSAELVEQWRPDVALVSCGRGNSFGHPARVVLDRLRAAGAAVVRTDEDGQITVETDGREVRVETFTGRRFARGPRARTPSPAATPLPVRPASRPASRVPDRPRAAPPPRSAA